MATFEIIANGDDGQAHLNGDSYSSSGSFCYLGNYTGDSYHNFFRFDNLTIPAGSTIDSAYLRVKALGGTSADDVNLNVYFEAEDDTAAPSSGANLIGKSLGSAVAWDTVESFSSLSWYNSPSLVTILQAIVDRAGWASGNAVTVHIKDNSSTASAYRQIGFRNYGAADAAELIITYSAAPTEKALAAGIGFNDAIDAQDMYGVTSEGLGISDAIDAFNTSGYIDEGLGISDAIDGFRQIEKGITSEIGFADAIDASSILNAAVASGLGLADAIDAFNWSNWLRENESQLAIRFIFTLTGSADSTTDAELKMESFSARKRSGDPTYLQVVLPGYAYLQQVTDRANGEMVIEQAFEVGGSLVLREEILRVDLEDISPPLGPMNRSIVLTGHKTETYSTQQHPLEDPTYYTLESNKKVYRFLKIDPYINPGDTAVIDSVSFAVDNIAYYVGPNYSQMELRE